MTDFGRRPAVCPANVLPKTGQTTTFRTGDDGYYEAGWENGDRFTDNGDGTITDNATNLMWPDDADGDGGNSGALTNWNGAIDYAQGLSFAGRDDWRLPNTLEILSIINHQLTVPAVYATIQNAQGRHLWSSTTWIGTTGNAWLWNSAVAAFYPPPKITPSYLLCCRDA